MLPTTRQTATGLGAAVAAICALAIVTVEVAGALAGLGAGGRPVLLNPFSALGTGWAVLTDPGTISRGDWPAQLRDGLPRREQLRPMVLIGLVAGTAVVMLPLGALRMARSDRRGRKDPAAARMATRRDLRNLLVRRTVEFRVTLGMFGGRLIAAEANASTIIIAPSQSFKSSGLVIPAVLEWSGPLLGVSVKGDLLADTIAARRKVGDVKVFDPMGSTGAPSACWSPVKQATTWTAARTIAAGLLQIDVAGGASQSQDKAFWRPAAQGYLAGLIYAANLADLSMADVSRWLHATSPAALAKATKPLRTARTRDKASVARDATDALLEIESIWAEDFDPRTRSSLVLTLSTALYAWGEQSVQDATAHAEDGITADWLLSEQNTLFLVAPSKDQQRLQGMFSALIQTVVDEAFARSMRNGGKPIDPRLLLVIDEAANTAPLPSLDNIASTGPGQGVTTLTVLQDLSQAVNAWGREKAQTIVNNHRAKVFGAGVSDPETLRYLATVLGDQAKERSTVSKDRGKLIELGSKTESIEHRKLLGPNELREADADTGLLIYGNKRPARITLRPWFEDRHLTRLRNGQPSALALLARAGRRWGKQIAKHPRVHDEHARARLAHAAVTMSRVHAAGCAAPTPALEELQLPLFALPIQPSKPVGQEPASAAAAVAEFSTTETDPVDW